MTDLNPRTPTQRENHSASTLQEVPIETWGYILIYTNHIPMILDDFGTLTKLFWILRVWNGNHHHFMVISIGFHHVWPCLTHLTQEHHDMGPKRHQGTEVPPARCAPVFHSAQSCDLQHRNVQGMIGVYCYISQMLHGAEIFTYIETSKIAHM